MACVMRGIVQDIEPGQTVGGYYAMQQKDCLKVQAVLPQLPELREQIANLKKQVRNCGKEYQTGKMVFEESMGHV